MSCKITRNKQFYVEGRFVYNNQYITSHKSSYSRIENETQFTYNESMNIDKNDLIKRFDSLLFQFIELKS